MIFMTTTIKFISHPTYSHIDITRYSNIKRFIYRTKKFLYLTFKNILKLKEDPIMEERKKLIKIPMPDHKQQTHPFRIWLC